MRLKYFMFIAILFAAGGIIYSVRSQLTPKPLPSFFVTEVMSSPVKDSQFLSTWTSARAVRDDGSWVKISIGIPPIQNERDIHDFKSWVVPDLGCFVLQKETIWTRNSDGVLLVDTKMTPISVSFQAVDELFAIPTSYTERTKDDAWNMFKQLTPPPL